MQNEKHELGRFIRSMPQTSGVYLMKDRLGQVIYVGKAKNLKRRVSSYFQGSRRFIRAQQDRCDGGDGLGNFLPSDPQRDRSPLLEEVDQAIPPKYNTDFTDDKQFLLVQVDLQNKLPRFRLCRNRKEDGSQYYGPLPRLVCCVPRWQK